MLVDALCRVCGQATAGGFAHCFCCATIVRTLRMPLAPVGVLVDYKIGDRMHRRLRGYKDAPVADVRRAHAAELAASIGRLVADARADLETRFGSAWDLVVTVPSSTRPAGTPVDALVKRVPALAAQHASLLVRGSEQMDHLEPARRGFEVRASVDTRWLRRQRIIVFDDTMITGARAQSAVAALRIAGGEVVGVVAVGRVVGRVASLSSPLPRVVGSTHLR
jgi:adenine/guanine phosphoribosyltransferase-like PRPP-binding protein